MNSVKSGLGSVAGADPIRETVLEQEAADTHARDPLHVAVSTMKRQLDTLFERASRFETEMMTALEQLRGQLRQSEEVAVQHRDAIVRLQQSVQILGQRADIMARQLNTFMFRDRALERAVQAKGPADDDERIVKKARTFYGFLREDMPEPTAEVDPPKPDGKDPYDEPIMH
jgi:hypothetical protein